MTTIKSDDFEDFVQGYVGCALWSSTDESTPEGGEPMDANYDSDDIAAKSMATMREECDDFVKANLADLTLALAKHYYGWHSAGHDFWLTRNRHGAGFWDRGLGAVGGRLSDAAHVYSGVDLYVGDDGKIYQPGAE